MVIPRCTLLKTLVVLSLCSGCVNLDGYTFEYEVRAPAAAPSKALSSIEVCTQGYLGSISGSATDPSPKRMDGDRKVYGEWPVVIHNGNKRYCLVVGANGADPQVFMLPIAARAGSEGWTDWSQPDFRDAVDGRDTSFEFIHGREKPSPLADPAQAFEMRFKLHRERAYDMTWSFIP